VPPQEDLAPALEGDDMRTGAPARTASRRLPGWQARIAGLIGGVGLVVAAGVNIGPAVSTFPGHGTRGYFVARYESCPGHGCTWHGRFQLPDGTVTRPSVRFAGSDPGMHAGSVVPALDTGAPGSVIPPGSGLGQWLALLLAGAAGTGLIAQWIWTVPVPALRRRRTAAAAAVPVIPHQDRTLPGSRAFDDAIAAGAREPGKPA
jgi:hypothetical protein